MVSPEELPPSVSPLCIVSIFAELVVQVLLVSSGIVLNTYLGQELHSSEKIGKGCGRGMASKSEVEDTWKQARQVLCSFFPG